ncbi:DUF805 domain-containing protein [Breznakiella homolactica]|uniref:DUF805 domain-containing protein n=1 Tax=Breznakiella homolactica TaxID=2798577 RepID=A0A7T7XMU7_9SPIR|nr:DUF805 domain-containing protein [Breznakiella homolactica]QQO09133.1 DUF805 domain-containing protein [Breznakiella homolactica]
MEIIINILLIILIFTFTIKKVNGRYFRFEYAINVLIIFYLLILLNLIKSYFELPELNLKCVNYAAAYILLYWYLTITIKRFYDLGMEGWNLLTLLIPIYGIIAAIYLLIKKGEDGINKFDKAIDYNKAVNKKTRIIDIYDEYFRVDNHKYYLKKNGNEYKIGFPKNITKQDIIKNYLSETHENKEDGYGEIITIEKKEFEGMIRNLKLAEVRESFYLIKSETKIFIRKENFKYSIILEKEADTEIRAVINRMAGFPEKIETKDYIIYKKIQKKDIRGLINSI